MFPFIESEPNSHIQSKQVAEFKDYTSGRGVEKNRINQEDLVMETGYDTFLREEKEEILFFLKKHILILKGLDASSLLDFETNKKSLDWTKLLKEAGAKSVNQLLKEVIPQYRPKLTLSTKELTNLRKKIKGWFNSEGSSEKRGDPLIHDDELPRFKEVLKQVMRVRNFEQLRKDVLPYVKEVRMKSSKKFVDSMFSKKFWSTFLHKEENKDIKANWESLPLLKDSYFHRSPSSGVKGKFSASSLDFLTEKQKSKMEEEFCFEDEQNDCIMEDEAHKFLVNFEETKTSSFNSGNVLIDAKDILQNPASEGFKGIQLRNQDAVQTDFLEDFWSTWNERSLTENPDLKRKQEQ